MPVYGLDGSFLHPENGMSRADMRAVVRAANKLGEVIIFRSTGPWSRRWIERRYPTKNFHVKGKSSDWGPQAGFVPYLGMYSKVGADATKAKDGTEPNNDGLKHKFAAKVQLALSLAEIEMQVNNPEEVPKRYAIQTMTEVPNSRDFFCSRSGPATTRRSHSAPSGLAAAPTASTTFGFIPRGLPTRAP